VNRAQRRAGKIPHSFRVRTGIHYMTNGTFVAFARIDREDGSTQWWESTPYTDEAEAERHRDELSTGIRAILAKQQTNLAGLRVHPVTKGGDA
jgi:hypothetical protein